MEREKTGAEWLLSEPEIVAWLGLDDKRNDGPAPPRRAESLGGGGARHDRQVERPGEVRRAVSSARGLRVGMAV
jgi:hypothetical protein